MVSWTFLKTGGKSTHDLLGLYSAKPHTNATIHLTPIGFTLMRSTCLMPISSSWQKTIRPTINF